MKKCPHCGMNIRDNVEVCGYCGGEIPTRSSQGAGERGAQALPQRNNPPRQAQKREPAAPKEEPGDGEGEEEEGGGLSAILQSGEKVLIGSLNVSVKKFFFHAYLTNKRIFLIDTQEKKLKVTAKDIPRETIADSSVEYSESSDPVLVLSVKSAADEDVKTMKLVFTQDGSDRSGEVEDWIALIHEEPEKKKPSRQAAAPRAAEPPEEEPEEYPAPEPEEELPPSRPVKQPALRDELHPTRKPLKEHERQPPVKRLVPMVQEPEEEPEPEPRVVPQRRVQVRTVEEQPRHRPMPVAREMPVPARNEPQPVKKPEIHAAMRTAMKNPVQPLRQTTVQPVRKIPSEPVYRPRAVTERAEEPAPVEAPVSHKRTMPEEPADNPQFCHNCGKRLPAEANFCPGCGTRLGGGGGHARTDTKPRMSTTLPRQAAPVATPSAAHQHKVPRIEEINDDDDDDVQQQPRRPPVKKTPKGSDMTILQKFLRR